MSHAESICVMNVAENVDPKNVLSYLVRLRFRNRDSLTGGGGIVVGRENAGGRNMGGVLFLSSSYPSIHIQRSVVRLETAVCNSNVESRRLTFVCNFCRDCDDGMTVFRKKSEVNAFYNNPRSLLSMEVVNGGVERPLIGKFLSLVAPYSLVKGSASDIDGGLRNSSLPKSYPDCAKSRKNQ